ncbi:MAG: hypothetical protein GC160_05885 [Acidobacteria bacterium]|nr:hypothetical protein [Acidobacteriota bacterium]
MLSDVLHQAIQELREELAMIDQVIRQIEAVDEGKPRRGRRPKLLSEAVKHVAKTKGRSSDA